MDTGIEMSEEIKNKLLLIDDEPDIVSVLSMSLKADGYDVLTAQSGAEGLAVFEREKPDIIITDIKMPGMDGIEVLEKIKALEPNAEVIIITGHGDIDNAIEALKFGASDFINKPIRDEALCIALQRATEKLKIKQQLKEYTTDLEKKMDSVAFFQDLREIKRLEMELVRSERLAAIGQTIAGLAHGIKNILHSLKGGSYLVDLGIKKNNTEKLISGWEMIKRNIDRMSNLVLDLLSYSKEGEPEYEACCPNEIANEVCELLAEKAKENKIKIVKDIDPSIGEVSADPRTIHEVLLNLMSNAIDACLFDENTGKSWQVKMKTAREKDNWIRFEVSDNGAGISEEVREKLFTSFFSTKGHRGTGLGLMVTRKLIEEHQGTVKVKSKIDKGTTFTVRLPC